MKTLLIVLAILVLLGMVVFILIHEHKKVEEVSKPDSDAPENTDEPEEEVEVEIAVPADNDEPETEAESELETESEVIIPEHCKPGEDPVDNLPNKYFFNIHKYISIRNRSMFCVVCSAVIKGNNYRVVVKNSYYPYLLSYTKKVIDGIVLKYKHDMALEEFLKTGSTNFNRVGEIVESL